MRFSISILFILFVAGCTHVPKETALLSATLGGDIAEAKRSHIDIKNLYISQRKARSEDYLRYVYTPRYIKAFIGDPKNEFKKNVCRAKGKMDQALEVQEVIEVITKKIEKKRLMLLKPIDATDELMESKLNDHYWGIQRANSSITSNLQSVSKGLELEKSIREAISKPLNKIIPIDEANKALDKLLEE